MPVTDAVDAPDPRTETARRKPYAASHHRDGTKSARGYCDWRRCPHPATHTVHIHRNDVIIRTHARCDDHAPADGSTVEGSAHPDPQRHLIYRAEESLGSLGHDETAWSVLGNAAYQTLVNDTTASIWWARHAEPLAGPITVTAKTDRRRSDGYAEPGRIVIPDTAPLTVVVHELAHHAAGFHGQPHSPVFAGHLIDLHAQLTGIGVARTLLAAYDAVGVHYRQPVLI